MKFAFLTADYEPCLANKEPTRVQFECPRRPGHMCRGLVIRDNPAGLNPPNQTWEWKSPRSRTSPTFTPSIDCKAEVDGMRAAGCGAHGYIENGVWRYA